MTDNVEKVYCCERPDNSALWAALTSARQESPAEIAALMNNGNFNNNPFIWLVFMMMFRNGFWGNGGENGVDYNSRQIAALQDSVNSNHNNDIALEAIKGNSSAIAQLAQTLNTDFSTMQTCCCDIKAAISNVGGQVGYSAERVINAVNLGDANIVSALKDCCCQNKELAIRGNYENQLATERQTNTLGSKIDSNFASSQLQACKDNGSVISRIDQLANGITQGFSATAYEAAKHTSEIIANATANTQRIIDTMTAFRSQDQANAIQDLKFQKSQLEQNQYIASLIKDKTCGCGGCGC